VHVRFMLGALVLTARLVKQLHLQARRHGRLASHGEPRRREPVAADARRVGRLRARMDPRSYRAAKRRPRRFRAASTSAAASVSATDAHGNSCASSWSRTRCAASTALATASARKAAMVAHSTSIPRAPRSRSRIGSRAGSCGCARAGIRLAPRPHDGREARVASLD
jgi:hypothetical protein